MNKKIDVAGESDSVSIPIRRNPQGSEIVQLSISVPKKLNQKINGIVVKTAKSRSMVITELIEKGLKNE